VSPDDLPGSGKGTIGLGLGFPSSVDRAYREDRITYDSEYSSERFAMPLDDEKPHKREVSESRTKKPLSQFARFAGPGSGLKGKSGKRGSNGKISVLDAMRAAFRVPRRLRPVLLLATAVVTFFLVLLSRSATSNDAASRLSLLLKTDARSLAPFGRRYVQGQGTSRGLAAQKKQASFGDGETHVVAHGAHRVKGKNGKGNKWAVTSSSLELSRRDELLALIGFITAATGTTLPATVDGSIPIDPAVLVGFDPTSPTATEDLALLVDEVNTQHPLVLFGTMRDPAHIELVRLLADYKIHPPPLIVDVDQRADTDQFMAAIYRLLGTGDLPQLVLQGIRLGDAHDLAALDDDEFRARLAISDAVSVRQLTPRERKGGSHGGGPKARAKAERERLLAPAPIIDH
jgi:hypothetical protein